MGREEGEEGRGREGLREECARKESGGGGRGLRKEPRDLRAITTRCASARTRTRTLSHSLTRTDLTRAMFLLRGNKLWTVPYMARHAVMLDITTDPRDAHLQVEPLSV